MSQTGLSPDNPVVGEITTVLRAESKHHKSHARRSLSPPVRNSLRSQNGLRVLDRDRRPYSIGSFPGKFEHAGSFASAPPGLCQCNRARLSSASGWTYGRL